jgi:DNA-binding transcriptional regulator YiaG
MDATGATNAQPFGECRFESCHLLQFMVTDEQYVEAIQTALTHVTVSELADSMSVSRPTIERWATGRNTPHQALRGAAMKFMTERGWLVKAGSTVHEAGCPCGFCKAGFTKA